MNHYNFFGQQFYNYLLLNGYVKLVSGGIDKIIQKGGPAKKQRKGNETPITIGFKDGALIIRKA